MLSNCRRGKSQIAMTIAPVDRATSLLHDSAAKNLVAVECICPNRVDLRQVLMSSIRGKGAAEAVLPAPFG